jgi:hypothetical protein
VQEFGRLINVGAQEMLCDVSQRSPQRWTTRDLVRRSRGVQAEMVETDPERFFRPPYVGHLGWLAVQLPEVDDDELNAICREAFVTVAPPSVLKMLPGPSSVTSGVSLYGVWQRQGSLRRVP